MSMTSDLITRLEGVAGIAAVVSGRIYPLRAPQSVDPPFIIVQKISRTRYPHSEAASGYVSTRMQVDSYGRTMSSAETLAELVRNSLDGFTGTMGSTSVRGIRLESERDIDEGPEHAQGKGDSRVSMDFIIQHRESVPTGV